MRRLLFFAGGGICGAVVGAAVALLLTPASGDDMRDGARGRVSDAVAEARMAARRRRQELEAQLADMTNPRSDGNALRG